MSEQLHIPITGDNSNFLSALNGARDGVRKTQHQVEESGESIEKMFKRIGAAAGVAFSLDAAKSFVEKIAETRSFFQDIESSMKVFLGNEQKAAEFTKKLKDYAYYNMFEFKDLAAASQQMIAYGQSVDTIIPKLDQLSNIAVGTHGSLMELVDAYNKAKSTGVVDAKGIQSWATKGVVIRDVLKEMGETATGTSITFEQLNKVLDHVTGEGGMFHNLQMEMMENISAEMGQFEDNLAAMYNEIGEKYQDYIIGAIKLGSSLVDNYEEIAKAVMALVSVYGVYKTATMAVVAVQNLQALGISALTTKEAIHYGWLVLCEKAQRALNAAMLTNPYVLMATVLAGVAAAYVTMRDTTTAEENALKSLEKTMDDVTEQQKKYNEETENAIEIAQNDAAATGDREEAMNLLIARYPEIIKKYIDEKGHLREILKLKQEIAIIDGNLQRKETTDKLRQTSQDAARDYQTLMQGKEDFTKNHKWSESSIDAYRRIKELYMEQNGGKHTPTIDEAIRFAKTLSEQANKKYARNLTENKISDFTKEGGALEKYTDDDLKRFQNFLSQSLKGDSKKKSQFVKELGDYLTESDRQSLLTRVEGMINARNQPKSTPSQRKAALKKELEDAQRALAAFDASSTQYTAREAEDKRKELQDAVDKAEKAYKAFGGKSLKNQQSEADKKKREAERQQRNNEQADQLQLKLRQQTEDDLTAIMQEGLDKRIKEINDAYEKEKADIDKNEKEIKEKRGGTLTAKDTEAIAAARQAAHKKYLKDLAEAQKEELSAMYSYLKDYGSFEQQKLAITEDYEQRIKDARTEGEKLRLQKEKETALQKLTFENISMGIDWSALLNGVGNLSQEMLKPMLEQLEAYTKTEEYNDAEIAEREKVVELIQELRNYVGTDQSSTWQELAKAISDFTASVAAYKEADKNEKLAITARDEAKKKLDKGEISKEEFDRLDREARELGKKTVDARDAMQSLGQTLNETSDKVRDYVSPLTTALNKAGAWAGVQGMDAVKGSVANIDALKGALDSALPSMGEGMAKTIGTGLSSALGSGLSVMGEGLSSVLSSSLGSVIGIVAQIPRLILDLVGNVKSMITGVLDSITELISLRWIDDFVNSILEAVGNLIDAIFDLPENLYHVLESIVVDGVGGLVNGVLGRVGNILTLGLLDSGGPASWFTNSNEKEVADTINRLTERNKLLQKSIEDLTDEMKTTRGTQAIRASREAEKLQKETNENYKQMAQAQAGYYSAHHSWNYYWGGYNQEQISRLSNQIGRSWNGDIWDLSPEEMKQLRSNVDMWNQIRSTGKGGYGESVADKLDAYIEQAGKLEEITNTLYENLTTTTKENVFDDFLNSLYDLADGSEDVFDDIADNWQAMVNRMVVNNLIGAKFQQKLEGWYEELAKLNEAKTNGDITDEEYRAKLELLKKQYEGYVTDAQRDIETLRNEGIIDATSANKEAYEQNASTGSWQGMSEDTGQELNGRFTALQVAGENISQGVITLIANMASLTSMATDRNNTLGEIRNLMIFNNAYLEDILEVNKKIYTDFKKELTKINSNTK